MRFTCAGYFLIAAFCSLTAAVQAANQSESAKCATSGPSSAGELSREWILQGWEKHRGDAPFSFNQKLGHLYHPSSKDMRLYDTFDPQHRVGRSATEWASIWTEPFTTLGEARHTVIDGPDVVGDELIAASTFEFAARLEKADGEIIGNRARTSLVWQCTSDNWKIVREHTSVRLVSREEIDGIVPH